MTRRDAEDRPQTWYGLDGRGPEAAGPVSTRGEDGEAQDADYGGLAWEGSAEPPGPEPVDAQGRYRLARLIARGGMGEVWEAHDDRLGVVVAMKVLEPFLAYRQRYLDLFHREARLTARLDHPGIVPVHDLGQLLDGRWFYTMKRFQGASRRSQLQPPGAPQRPEALRARIGLFLRACEAVAFAHAAGVVHRDIKPDNIVVGALGEVLVVDWGIALVMAEVEGRPDQAGTFFYMAPEQRRAPQKVGPASDVWALGVVLHQLLCGRRPAEGPLTPGTPEELSSLVADCLEKDPAARLADAGLVATRLARWLDGEDRRDRALEIVAEADRCLAEAARLRAQAGALESRASAALAQIPSWRPVDDKLPHWREQDLARTRGAEARVQEVRHVQLLNAALTHLPELPEARAGLAAWYRARHEEAEREARSGEGEALLLKAFDDGTHAAYLAGRATLGLDTLPSGATVEIDRYVLRDRRLCPEPTGLVVQTPFRALALTQGSYRLRIHHPDCEEIVYPVLLGRLEDWALRPPGADGPTPLQLPPKGSLGSEDRYVAGGWTWVGGEAGFANAIPRQRAWVDSAILQKFPIRQADFLRFLNALVGQGRLEEAMEHAPRASSAHEGRQPPLYDFDPQQGFSLTTDAQGDTWLPEWPLMHVERAGLEAFAVWEAQRTGRPWRLPREDEWERAARGADGRVWPWGPFFEATWTSVRDSHQGVILPRPVGHPPQDEGPFGVRDMGGGIREICETVWPSSLPAQGGEAWNVVRGAAFTSHARLTMAFARSFEVPELRSVSIGGRLARSPTWERAGPGTL